MNLTQIAQEIIEGIEWVGEEAVKLAEALGTIIGIAGPSGLRLATDIAADVAQGSVTPAQATAQLADVVALGKNLAAAAEAIKAQQAPPEAPPADPQAAATANISGGGMAAN